MNKIELSAELVHDRFVGRQSPVSPGLCLGGLELGRESFEDASRNPEAHSPSVNTKVT